MFDVLLLRLEPVGVADALGSSGLPIMGGSCLGACVRLALETNFGAQAKDLIVEALRFGAFRPSPVTIFSGLRNLP
jgi:hypothetical protein